MESATLQIECSNAADMTDWPDRLDLAPVVICPYSRHAILKETVTALQNNTLASQTALFIFSDAPYRPDHTADIQKVRDYLHTITPCVINTDLNRIWGRSEAV